MSLVEEAMQISEQTKQLADGSRKEIEWLRAELLQSNSVIQQQRRELNALTQYLRSEPNSSVDSFWSKAHC